ncbi:BRD4-interacting chromatin-remodeling complex-associated protein-like isoform X2 [Heptranchias perlo]|uniref:BRD4-interacting chromatin-remodeling complex-associated protein-like isoform X2 n=1 Tax=Heptranchias perlo TaxID=212740 RepID=UPI0035593FF3
MMSARAVDMDDEDGRCLLDVICDPQALNEFLHGSDQLDGDDLLDTTADPASAFFTDASLNVQDTTVNHLNSGQTQTSSSAVDLDFLEDDILGPSPGPGSNLQNSDQPCDILQQSLQEANITEQSLEEDADLDIASLHFPSLQPVSQAADASQLFSTSADLIGLQQQPTVLTQQTLIQQQTVGGQVVNKAINVQPFLQQVGLGNVTLQPVSNLQGLPNGSPSGTLGIGQIQVVGQLSNQSVMTINQPTQQIITKAGQPTQVTTVPVGSYISSPASDPQQVALNSAGVSPPNTGLVLQKNAPSGALNGNSLFAATSMAQANQPLTVRPNLSNPMMQAPLSAQNVIIQRTPTPIQPKPTGGVIQHKLFQISSKPFTSANTALTIQNEASLQQQQQQKAQQNVTFMTGKSGQNVVFSASGTGFPQTISSSVFKQHQAQQQVLGKSLSLHLQGGSIVIQPQHMQQAMLQSQNPFLLQGQLSGASSVPLPQQLSALQANVGGQILTAQSAGGQPPATHIIASQGPGGQLIANQTLPAQILTNQNIAGQLNLSQVIAAQNAHGATHILSAPIQLQSGQVGQPTVFQMANSLNAPTSASVQATLAGSALSQQSQSAVLQGVTLPNQVTMLNSGENLPQTVSIQQTASNAQNSSVIQQQQQQQQSGPGPSLMALGNGQPSLLTVQTAPSSQAQPQPQLPIQQQQLPSSSQSSSTMVQTPGKIIISQQGPGASISQDTAQMFFQQQEQKQQQLYQAALKLQQEKGLNQPSPHSLAPTVTTSSVPASVIVSSSVGLAPPTPASRAHTPTAAGHADSKGQTVLPPLTGGHFQQILAGQMVAGQQKTTLQQVPVTSQSPLPQIPQSEGQLHLQQMQPSPHQMQPSPHQMQPSPHQMQPSPHQMQPSPHQMQPSPHQMQPSPHQMQPSPHQMQPSPHQMQPSPHQMQPSPHQMQPSPHQMQPSPHQMQPSPHQMQPSPHQSRPPSQPQPLSRPPSRPQSRPSSQPQVLSRPPSEPLSRSCTPSQLPLQPLYVIQTQVQPSPQAQLPMRPPSQPHLQLQFQNPPQAQHQADAQAQPQLTSPTQIHLQVQPTPQAQSQSEVQGPAHLLHPSPAPPQAQAEHHPDPSPAQSHPQQVHLQFHRQPPSQAPLQPVYQTLHLTVEQQQRFQMVTGQLQSMSAIPNPTQQHKNVMEQLQQMQHNIILQAKQSAANQAVSGLGQLTSQAPAMLISGQVQSASVQAQVHTTSGGMKTQPHGGGQAALATLLQQTSVLVKTSSAGTTATTRSPDSKVISGGAPGGTCHLQQGTAVPIQMKPLSQHQIQPALQTKPGVISSISGLNMSLAKGPIQIQLLGKGLTQLMPATSVQTHQQMENKMGGLKTPGSLQQTKEAVVLDRLHKDQDAVLQPDYKTPFRSYEDVVHRLLPYHLYQGTSPSGEEHRKVDEEFEAVSSQLLKRTQAMLNKYRMLLFEEARRLSPSAEMVMIDRMFIQEEKTSLSTDKQLAKEKPDEYVASSSRSHGLATSSPSPSSNTSTASLQSPRIPSIQTATQIHPTKLVIKHTGGSPSVSWAKCSASLDGDDDTLHTRSRPPPMKTYEARSRIGLKLKIKQEAGLSKVVHNTALDPVHQAVTTSSVIKSTECPLVTSVGQMNGTLDHATPSPTENQGLRSSNYCKLPPRKTYRDKEQSLSGDRTAINPSPSGPVRVEDSRREMSSKCEVASKSVIATCKSVESPKLRTVRGRPEDASKVSSFSKKARTHTNLLPPKSEEPPGGKVDDGAGGHMKELSDVEDELMHGVIKAEPPDGSWELPLPPAKRSKSESFDMDNASFSSDSPQDDTLNEHLQSAIDSILNLRQPQSVSVAQNPVSSPYNSSEMNSSPFSPTPHSDSYLAPNHNGGLGARTYTR